MEYMEKCNEIKQEFSLMEISFIIDELRQYVNANALTTEVASRANGTLMQDRLQAQMDKCFHYGLTHGA